MEPINITIPVANFTYSFEESYVLFNGSSSYDPNGEIVSYDWDFGDGNTGSGELVYHKYCEVGEYYVTLTVTDNDGIKIKKTKSVEITNANVPPSPEIDGPNRGKPGIEYEYEFYVIDPDPDDYYLLVAWGDGNSTGWIGPYIGNVSVKLSHIWNKTGTYVIKVKVRDFCGDSEWAEFKVEIQRNRITFYSLLHCLFERFPLLERLLFSFRMI